MSSKSNEVCGRIIDTGLHQDMLEIISWDTSFVNTDQSNALLVMMILFTLQNVVRRSEPARVALKNCQAVDVLQKFRYLTENLVILLRICSLPSRYGSYDNPCYLTLHSVLAVSVYL